MTSIQKELQSPTLTSPMIGLALRSATLVVCLALIAGCKTQPANTFTFTAELPPGFAYEALAEYEPINSSETCRAIDLRKTANRFNRNWREKYEPVSEIVIRKTINGCPMVIRRIDLDIRAAYGKDWSDISAESAAVVIRPELEDRYKGTFNDQGLSVFYGECQWLFRTSGKPRILRKLLDCKETDALGKPEPGRPFAAYTHDQLPGKTVKMKIWLVEEERPGWKDTWVKVPNGWKRCLGDGYDDQHAYCNGNYTDFSTFKMPDGRICSIYPACTE
ncbi:MULTISPECIES: hypothetical protein [Pseudomonas]|uniref:hypothetical protein n=1 Tax=Pseudomonas TaxID=286 RepID=UPI001F32F5D4|nr:hypothetical protein [Pseudomonas sputi]